MHVKGLSATFEWRKFSSTFSFNHPAVHVVELRGREPNCRISHVYFGKTNANEADALQEVDRSCVRRRPGPDADPPRLPIRRLASAAALQL